MIPGGYGFEVLKFEDESLRDIAKLPADVRIVCALTDPCIRHYGATTPDDWFVGGALRPIYILICHRYCLRVSPGQFYMFSSLEDFLKQYAAFDQDERQPLPPCGPDNQLDRIAWHRGEDGKAQEYVWHEVGGWVPRWCMKGAIL